MLLSTPKQTLLTSAQQMPMHLLAAISEMSQNKEGEYVMGKKILLSAVIVVVLFGIYNINKITPVLLSIFFESEPMPKIQPCELLGNEVYCDQYYAYDGLIRFTVSSTEQQHCCQIKREVTSRWGKEKTLKTITSYDERVCTIRPQIPVDCSKYQKIINAHERAVIIDEKFLIQADD